MKRLEVFTQDLCPFCNMAKEFLNFYKIPHYIRDTSSDPEARREFKRIGAEKLPVFLVDGRMYEGFNPSLLRAVIAKAFGILIPLEDTYVPKTNFKRFAIRNPELIPRTFAMGLRSKT